MPAQSPIAIITGAGSGIGRASAVAMANAGFTVVLAGRRAETLDETARLITANADAPAPRTHVTDVADPASVKALFDMVEREFARVDVLFNNAGVGSPDVPLEQIGDDAWLACVQTNLSGAFYCTREAFRIMKSQRPRGGRIINNGSISAETPRPNSAPYTATKHAVTGLTKSTALDGRPFDIACGQIDIGNAATDMAAKMARGVKQADGTTAVEPTIDVEHVARAVVYMATLPLDANVLRMTVMATGMRFVGRG